MFILSWRSHQPSTSTATTPISATKRKFGYIQGLQLHERISAAERRQRPFTIHHFLLLHDVCNVERPGVS